MDTATWVIAGASIGNVIVLGLYAYFTWGLWSEAARTALRTEELVRQATDALRLQVVATYLEEKRPLPGAIRTMDGYPEESRQHLEAVKTLLRKAFSDQWGEIERILNMFPESRMR